MLAKNGHWSLQKVRLEGRVSLEKGATIRCAGESSY